MSAMNKNELDFFSKNGYLIFDVETKSAVDTFYDTVKDSLDIKDLTKVHDSINVRDINESRMSAFRRINKITDWEKIYASIALKRIKELLGPDIAIQSKLNLSIQMPRDESSILSLHTDALSGQSVFELVLWVPLTNSFESNSMYIYSPTNTYDMLSQLPTNEIHGMNYLFKNNRKSAKFLNIKFGKALLFTPTMFHGNILNTTNTTRVSINCRFKNIFSTESTEGERKLGSFYKILELSPITNFGLAYRDDYLTF